MITIDSGRYHALVDKATILEQSPKYGPNVWRTDDNRIIKAFHRRHRFLGRHRSHARRFMRHARKLHALGIRSATVVQMYRCPAIGCELVVYPMLPGRTLRNLPVGSAQATRALAALPRFLAWLHRRGVYFRGFHLGNILYDPQEEFALIDVGFMRFYPWPLNAHKRASNFLKIMRYERDIAQLEAYGFDQFLQQYLGAAGLPRRSTNRIARMILDNGLPHTLDARSRKSEPGIPN